MTIVISNLYLPFKTSYRRRYRESMYRRRLYETYVVNVSKRKKNVSWSSFNHKVWYFVIRKNFVADDNRRVSLREALWRGFDEDIVWLQHTTMVMGCIWKGTPLKIFFYYRIKCINSFLFHRYSIAYDVLSLFSSIDIQTMK